MAIFLTYSFIVLCAVGTLGFYLLYFATDKQLVIANIIIGNVTRLFKFYFNLFNNSILFYEPTSSI